MLNTHITVRDLAELRRLVGERVNACIHEPRGNFDFRFATPTFGFEPGAADHAPIPARSTDGYYLEVYDWDSLMFAEAIARLLGIKGLLIDVVKNFLKHQGNDGFVPRTISTTRIWDEGDLCKPFMCQMLAAALKRGEIALVEIIPHLDQLEKLLTYYREQRWHRSFGLYHWANVLESGVDSNPTLLFPREAKISETVDGNPVVTYPDGRLLATDLNAYMFAELLAFGTICAMCGYDRRARHYEQLAAELQENIETTLWNDGLGMYANFDPLTNEPVLLRSWTGLAPTLFGVSTSERARRVITENILSETHFLRPFGIASLAASEHLHNQAPRALYGRALVCNWSGPVWILPNVLVSRTLVAYNFIKEARDVATRVLRAVLKDLFDNGTMHENYHCDTGRPLWARNFMSWNANVLELAALLERESTEATPELVTA